MFAFLWAASRPNLFFSVSLCLCGEILLLYRPAGREDVPQLARQPALARREGAVEGGRADGEGIAARLLQGPDAGRAVDAAGADQPTRCSQSLARGLHQIDRIGLRGAIGQ